MSCVIAIISVTSVGYRVFYKMRVFSKIRPDWERKKKKANRRMKCAFKVSCQRVQGFSMLVTYVDKPLLNHDRSQLRCSSQKMCILDIPLVYCVCNIFSVFVTFSGLVEDCPHNLIWQVSGQLGGFFLGFNKNFVCFSRYFRSLLHPATPLQKKRFASYTALPSMLQIVWLVLCPLANKFKAD